MLWLGLGGVYLLLVASMAIVQRRIRLPAALIYLPTGVLLGSAGLDVVDFDVELKPHLEIFAQVAVLVSLFVGGLRLRIHWREPEWHAVLRLAAPGMVLSILGLTVAVVLLLGWPPSLAMLLAAMLAPTDPVLSGSVAIRHSSDRDGMRFALSGEAGLNDGFAAPFVSFALSWCLLAGGLGHGRATGFGPIFGDAAITLLWSAPVGLLIGYGLGRGVGRITVLLQGRSLDDPARIDFIALALMALSYSIAESLHTLGFLAVFAAGIGLRGAEVSAVHSHPHPDHRRRAKDDIHPPAESLVQAEPSAEDLQQPAIAAGVLVSQTLSFGDTAEKLLEVMIVITVGIALVEYFDARALGVALVLFLVVRPFSVWASLIGSPPTFHQRRLIGWFGFRGISTLYYLAYAESHGLDPAISHEFSAIVLTVVALSILVHGASTHFVLGSPQDNAEASG